jgi:hypothetical protein
MAQLLRTNNRSMQVAMMENVEQFTKPIRPRDAQSNVLRALWSVSLVEDDVELVVAWLHLKLQI